MANITFNGRNFGKVKYTGNSSNEAVNIIRVNGKVKWRKPVTITLRSEVDSFRFDNETYKEIETYYGYRMRYFKQTTFDDYFAYTKGYFVIYNENNDIVSKIQLSSLVSAINTFNLTDGETVTVDQTFYFIPIEQTLKFSNRTLANVPSITVKINDEPTETISGNEKAVYSGDNVTITIESLYRLKNESQFDTKVYGNDYIYYTKTINKISISYIFDLTPNN